MTKEQGNQPFIEQELKLPVRSLDRTNQRIEQLATRQHPRTFEHTMMLDVLTPPKEIVVVHLSKNGKGSILIPDHFSGQGSVTFGSREIFSRILSDSGIQVENTDEEVIFSSQDLPHMALWNTEACLRYRYFKDLEGQEQRADIAYKRTLQKIPIRREIEHETSTSDHNFF